MRRSLGRFDARKLRDLHIPGERRLARVSRDLQLRFAPFRCSSCCASLQAGGLHHACRSALPATVGMAGLLRGQAPADRDLFDLPHELPRVRREPDTQRYQPGGAWLGSTWSWPSTTPWTRWWCPPSSSRKLLHKRGLRNRKLLVLDRWADLERVPPALAHRVAGYWERCGRLEPGEATIKLRVPRARKPGEEPRRCSPGCLPRACMPNSSRSDALDRDRRRPLSPARLEEQDLTGPSVVHFTGCAGGRGAESRALASCDVKLFPSTTDTWGNAPLGGSGLRTCPWW